TNPDCPGSVPESDDFSSSFGRRDVSGPFPARSGRLARISHHARDVRNGFTGPCARPLSHHLPNAPTRTGPETIKERHSMSTRQSPLLGMKDLIEHMSQCHEQLQWAADGRTETFLTERLLGDLVECQKLCQELQSRPNGLSRLPPV